MEKPPNHGQTSMESEESVDYGLLGPCLFDGMAL